MARIEFPDANGRPQRFDIPETTPGVVIGRSPSCHCVIPNHSVGRNHGRITFEDGRFVYSDLGSVNGSYLNDRKLTSPVPLTDGDLIVLGEVSVRFVLDARRATAAVKPDLPSRTICEVESPSAPAPVPRRPAGTAARPAAEPPRPLPGADASGLAEVARLRKENTALRAEVQSASGRDAGADGSVRSKADALSATLAERDEEVRHLRGLIADGERRIKDAESRATMATSSLESMHSKYLDMREQVSHLQSLLDGARLEASDREAEAAEMRDKVAALTTQVDSIRGRSGQTTEEISNLKVKLTERDREIERLRREMDSREYDLKALREENEHLEEYCQSDTGRQQELERKVRNLEAVIDENRNLIAELRRGLEEKDRELRQVRLGVGIADLEQEKQRLLDDYHKKSRELDVLRTSVATLHAEVASITAEKDDLLARLRVLEDAAKVRRSEREDISDHPEYRAKAREVETLTDTVRSLTEDLQALRHEAAEYPGQQARLAAEAVAASEKAKALSHRVDELQTELARRPSAAQAVEAVAPGPEVVAGLGRVADALEALGDGLVVLQSAMKDAAKVLEALSLGEIPAPVRDALGGSTPGEMAESVRDVRRMVSEDLAALRKAWEAGRRLWQPGP